MTEIQPCGYRILIKPDPIEKTTKSGIVLMRDSEGERERAGQIFGVVVKMGTQAYKGEEPWACVGDRVMFSKYSGKTIVDAKEEQNYILINDEDVIALVPELIDDDPVDGEVTA